MNIRLRTLKDGRRVYDLRVDGPRTPDGRRKQLQFRGLPNKQAAKDKAAEVRTAIRNQAFVEPSKVTLQEYMTEWLDGLQGRCRPTTLDSYRRLMAASIFPMIGSVALHRLTADRLNRFYSDLLTAGRRDGKGGLSPRTVRYTHAIIRKALNDAARRGRVLRNVADQADPPKQRTPEMRTWTGGQLRAFLDHVRDDQFYPAWRTLAMTGLRRSELLGLSWRHVNLEAGRLSIRQTLTAIAGRLEYGEPKTASGKRSVALDAETVSVLREHRQRQQVLALDGLVFTMPDGSPVHPDSFGKMFDAHVRGSRLPRIRLHDLRHTHASIALQAGVHPKVVSGRLGHASIVITLQTYSHVIPALHEEAAETIAALV